MLDSDGIPQRDDRHHRRSRSRSAVSPRYTGETLAERQEQRLADAAVPVGLLAGRPRAAPTDPRPPAQEPVPAEEAAPAAQATAPAAPPSKEAPGEQGAESAAAASRAAARAGQTAAPCTPLQRETGPARALSASPGAAAAAAESRQGATYRAHTKPSHTRTSPLKPYPPKAAFRKGRPRPVRPPAPTRTALGITLPQLQRQREAERVIQEGGDRAVIKPCFLSSFL